MVITDKFDIHIHITSDLNEYYKSRSNNHDWDEEYGDDPDAFLYKIRSNGISKAEIFPVQNTGKLAKQYYQYGYLSFGNTGYAFYCEEHVHFDDGNEFDIKVYASWKDCAQYNLKQYSLNGRDTKFFPKEIEVFQLQI